MRREEEYDCTNPNWRISDTPLHHPSIRINEEDLIIEKVRGEMGEKVGK